MTTRNHLLLVISVLALATLACAMPGSGPQEPTGPVQITGTIPPIDITGGIDGIDVCAAIPKQVIESARGIPLVSSQPFGYYDTLGSVGCQYDFGKSADKEAFFGYVALTPASAYGEQPLYLNKDVSGIGDAAFFNNGADARQLWVKLGDKAALVVAFGDVPQEERVLALAKLVVAAIQR